MKRTIHILILFYCLLGHTYLTCYGIDSYSIQIAASKTPSDVKWLSSKYQIDQEILEIKENGWYKYVISQFDSNSAASKYIALHLQSNGLQGPFPRLLPDSLKEYLAKNNNREITFSTNTKDTIPSIITDLPTSENEISVQPISMERGEKLNHNKHDPLEKYSRWEKMISGERLQNFEIKLIEGTKSFLPRSVAPFYTLVIEKAIRVPVILFFLMLILLFVMNTVMILITLEISNPLKNQIERYNNLYQTMYERALTGYFFQEFDIETAVSRMKKIHRQRNRKILVSVLFNFQKNLSGESDQKILDIFFRLGLNEDALKKIKSHSFYRQIVGLRELTNLYPTGALSIVESHINDRNDELRAEAQTSYVRLNHEKPFNFIKNLRKPYTRWTQLTSFYIFKLHKLPSPSFAEFLQSDLYNVQNFSLRMITYCQQKENAEEIIKLLDAPRQQTRFLAIKAISDLGIREAKSMLKERFEKETHRNKIEIVKALLHIGDNDDFNYLEQIIREDDVALKIEACRSMHFMNTSGMENLLRLKQEKELFLGPFIAHIYDPRN